MSTINVLTSTENGANSMSDINTNFSNLNADKLETSTASATYLPIASLIDASTSSKGITKLSVAPASATSPIAVGDNDNRVSPVSLVSITAGKIDALAGTSGTPSSTNKYVTNDDTSGTGAVVRNSLLVSPVQVTRLAGYSPATNTTENTVFTTTVTGGLLSTTGMIRVRTPVSFSLNATAETWTIKLKYGGSTLFTNAITTPAVGAGNALSASGFIDVIIANNSATNSQNVGFYVTLAPSITSGSNQVSPYGGHSADTTSAIDTTSNQTLAMTVTRTNGSGGVGTFYQTIVETLK